MTALALCTDLLFTSKITETARSLGVACPVARDLASLLAHARGAPPSLVIVDMVLRAGDATLAIRALRAEDATRAAHIVAFLPHTREDLIAAAEAAGANVVLTKGQLTRQLPALLGK